MIVHLEQATQHLKNGGVLAYPTEAVWGLGCDPYNPAAFQAILQLKQRPIEKGVILVAANLQQAEPFLSALSAAQRHKIKQTWLSGDEQQQATTWLVPCTDAVPAWISGQYTQVAIRVTHHPLVQQLCLGFGGAIVSTSANPSGQAPALNTTQLTHYFSHATGLAILDGQLGSCRQPSKIIDIVSGHIIRA